MKFVQGKQSSAFHLPADSLVIKGPCFLGELEKAQGAVFFAEGEIVVVVKEKSFDDRPDLGAVSSFNLDFRSANGEFIETTGSFGVVGEAGLQLFKAPGCLFVTIVGIQQIDRILQEIEVGAIDGRVVIDVLLLLSRLEELLMNPPDEAQVGTRFGAFTIGTCTNARIPKCFWRSKF